MLASFQHIRKSPSINKNKMKRNIIFQSYNDIQFQPEKENKENISINLRDTPIKLKLFEMKNKLINGCTPIISKNKKIIMFTEDKYDKALQRGRSPFFISDKINFRNEFKSIKLNEDVKPKHLGLCDYYMKKKKNNIREVEEEKYDFSKTPRFHKEEH